jgi:phosphoribosyl 1,2-cyclic phosphodiesterase
MAAPQKKPSNPDIRTTKNNIFATRMTLYIASLNSGSNGNCYYVGNSRESVLIDAGIPCRETERRMRKLGLSLSTESTRQQIRLSLEPQLVRRLDPTEPVTTGELTVTPFPKTHDASDPCSFVVSSPAVRIGIFTDLGVVCEQLIRHFRQCHAAFLETNYDERLLDEGRYPHFLKNRIRGGLGHLSNRQALDLFIRHRPAFMSHLFPSHLSRDNNRPELVRELFENEARGTKIVIASRDHETELYAIDGLFRGQAGSDATPGPLRQPSPVILRQPSIVQGSLFK